MFRTVAETKYAFKKYQWDFPGSTVVKTLCFQHRRHGFNPCWETKIPLCHVTRPKRKNLVIISFVVVVVITVVFQSQHIQRKFKV